MTSRAPPRPGVSTPKGCSMTACLCLAVTLLLICAEPVCGRRRKPYYGVHIGPLNTFAHGVNGTVFLVDESTFFIKGFNYDGMGPDTYFWAGDSTRPSPDGFIVPFLEDDTTNTGILLAHTNSNLILKLPSGKRIRDIKWLCVWCRRFTVTFAEILIKPGIEPPRPRVLPEFKRLAHGLRSGNISVLDEKTFYIPNLHYDGAGPDAYFWVGNREPSPFGTKVPNEMGSLHPLRGYQGEDIEIQLPSNLTVHDIDWLAVWCVLYKHNFGHVYIPKDLDVPPALGQTKITTTSTTTLSSGGIKNANCKEFLDKRLQVQWEIQDDQVQITLSAKLRKGQYMAFGLSGQEGTPMMVGADVAVAYWDHNGNQPKVVDYSITDPSQCDGNRGVCPDTKLGGTNDVELVSGQQKNGVTRITYRRPLSTLDEVNDKPIIKTNSQSVIAAFGPLNSRNEANAHSFMDTTRQDQKIYFASETSNSCSELAELDKEGPKPWPIRIISGTTNFTAKIGPTGGKRGYSAITGHPSWGIAWYINDQLIPELYVERGQTYTFIVEGGQDRTNPAEFHPFYICDSSEGGFGQKNPEEQNKQRVFAGVAYDAEGYPYPSAKGRYCEWKHKSIDQSLQSETFERYMDTLELDCKDGEPAVLTWPVEKDTPDLVYYQCYTHSNLGWKIHVVNPGTPVPPSTDSLNKAETTKTLATLLLALTILFTLTTLR